VLLDRTIAGVVAKKGGRHVFVTRAGALEAVRDRTLEPRNLPVASKNIARACGDEISDVQPMLDARLEDGSRVAAMFPPCSVNGPTLTIRKFTRRYSLDDLIDVGSLTLELASQLQEAIRDRRNILISGGTGTGKTTLLNALAATIPDADRIVLIEETSEITIDKPNLVRFEARRHRIVASTCGSGPLAPRVRRRGFELHPRPGIYVVPLKRTTPRNYHGIVERTECGSAAKQRPHRPIGGSIDRHAAESGSAAAHARARRGQLQGITHCLGSADRRQD